MLRYKIIGIIKRSACIDILWRSTK